MDGIIKKPLTPAILKNILKWKWKWKKKINKYFFY